MSVETLQNPLHTSVPDTRNLTNILPLPGFGMSVVYFLRRESDGAIKIGRTGVFHVRQRNITRAIGEPVTPLAAVRGYVHLEGCLHRHFKQYRLDGEWFEPCGELLQFIDWLNRGGPR